MMPTEEVCRDALNIDARRASCDSGIPHQGQQAAFRPQRLILDQFQCSALKVYRQKEPVQHSKFQLSSSSFSLASTGSYPDTQRLGALTGALGIITLRPQAGLLKKGMRCGARSLQDLRELCFGVLSGLHHCGYLDLIALARA